MHRRSYIKPHRQIRVYHRKTRVLLMFWPMPLLKHQLSAHHFRQPLQYDLSRSKSSADNVISSPDRSTTTVLSRTSFISPPYAPAFIYKAPPTDPGIPQENSSPVNVLANASLETSIIRAPLPATITVPFV